MSAKRGLGRGFESLIPSDFLDESFDPTAGDDHRVSELRHIKLDEIAPDPDQPRRHFDEAGLNDLTQSVSAHGVVQPIVVTPKQSGGYEIVAGERRWRASKAAGLKTIPALVRTLSDQHRLELALIENLQRKDLNPLEMATAYAKLREQFNLSLEEISQTVGGRSVSAVSNTLRLLKLTDAAKQALAKGTITEGQARPLIDLRPEQVDELLPKITSQGWSARQIEQAARDTKKNGTKIAAIKPALSHELEMTQQRLAEQLGTRVVLRQRASNGGQIVISYRSKKELDAIAARFE